MFFEYLITLFHNNHYIHNEYERIHSPWRIETSAEKLVFVSCSSHSYIPTRSVDRDLMIRSNCPFSVVLILKMVSFINLRPPKIRSFDSDVWLASRNQRNLKSVSAAHFKDTHKPKATVTLRGAVRISASESKQESVDYYVFYIINRLIENIKHSAQSTKGVQDIFVVGEFYINISTFNNVTEVRNIMLLS